MNDAANGHRQDDAPQSPEDSRMGDLRKRVFLASAYYAAVIAVLLLSHWFTFKVETSSVVVLIALVAPFIIGRLSSFEFGGLKVELNEFKHEVRGATNQLSQEVSNTRDELNSKFDQLVRRSQEYLRPQPLEVSDAKADQLRKEIDITDEETSLYLASPNPNERILAYIQLQKWPDSSRLSNLADCFYLEDFLASTQKETRPLWQLLVAVDFLYRMSTETETDKRKILMAMRHCLEWLEADASADPDGQCKARLRQLIERSQ